VLIFLLTGSRNIFERNETVRTYMADGAGMTESTPVRLNGILVGAVQGIKLSGSKDPRRAVEFELTIQEKLCGRFRKTPPPPSPPPTCWAANSSTSPKGRAPRRSSREASCAACRRRTSPN
jgi:hypothetical protein